jgi:hypothetical protein
MNGSNDFSTGFHCNLSHWSQYNQRHGGTPGKGTGEHYQNQNRGDFLCYLFHGKNNTIFKKKRGDFLPKKTTRPSGFWGKILRFF